VTDLSKPEREIAREMRKCEPACVEPKCNGKNPCLLGRDEDGEYICPLSRYQSNCGRMLYNSRWR